MHLLHLHHCIDNISEVSIYYCQSLMITLRGLCTKVITGDGDIHICMKNCTIFTIATADNMITINQCVEICNFIGQTGIYITLWSYGSRR